MVRRLSSRLDALDHRIGPSARWDDRAKLRRVQERAAAESGITVEQLIVETNQFRGMTIEEMLALPGMVGVSPQELVNEVNRLLADEEVDRGSS